MKGKFLVLTISILTLNTAYCSIDQSSIETHRRTIDAFDSTTPSELPKKKQRLDDRSTVKRETPFASDDATNATKEETLLDLLLSQKTGRAFLDCILVLDHIIDVAICARERRSAKEAEKTFAEILPYLSGLVLQLSENKELSHLNDFGKYIQRTIESDKDFKYIPYENVFKFARKISTEIRKLIPDDNVWGFICEVERMIRLEYLLNDSPRENDINEIEIGHKAQRLRVELKELYDLLYIEPGITNAQNLPQISDSAMRHIKEIAKEFGPPISYVGVKKKVIDDLLKGIVTGEHTKSPRDVIKLSFDILGWIMQNWAGMFSSKMRESLPVLEKQWTNMFNTGDPSYISEAE